MEITIDGQAGAVTPEPGSTLASVTDALEVFLAGQGRAAAALVLDGVTLSREARGAFARRKIEEFRQLDVTTRALRDEVVQLLGEAQAGIPAWGKNLSEAGVRFQQGKVREGLATIVASVEHMASLVTLMVKAQLCPGTRVDAALTAAAVPKDLVQRMQNSLAGLKGAIERRDSVTLGDVTEYELRPMLDQWALVLKELGKQMAAHPGP